MKMGCSGYRFCPTDEEMLDCLRKKVNDELSLLPTDVFTECNLYGDNREPWRLFDESSEDTLFVFTPLVKKTKSRINRVAGSGVWDCKGPKVRVKKLGFRRYYVFKINNCPPNPNHNGHWVMHEFTLVDVDSYALCKVRFKRDPTPDDDDDDADDAPTQPIQPSQSCKKRAFQVGHELEDQPCKKIRSLSVVQEPAAAASPFSDDGTMGTHDLATFSDDGTMGTHDLATPHEDQDPDFVLSSLTPETELFSDVTYADYLNYLVYEEQSMEENSEHSGLIDEDDLNLLTSFLNQEEPEENRSICHGTNIELTMPITSVF